MASNDDRPHLLVAIDLGMTYTGVAYASLASGTERARAQVIQKWPGRARNHVESKVPTTLLYPLTAPDGPLPQPEAWGFMTEMHYEQTQVQTVIKEWFKILLDEKELQNQQRYDPDGAPRSIEEVEKCIEDYFRLLYGHIKQELSSKLTAVSWEEAKIEFIFSVPTTWTDQRIIERFRTVIKKAGYQSMPSHTVEIGLTEAEAAAIWTVKEEPEIYRPGEIILVLDAGGGTDLTALKIQSTEGSVLTLEQVDVVQGKSVGSTNIDLAFERMMQNRLKLASESIPLPLSSDELFLVAYNASKSNDFLNWKCEFGSDATRDFLSFVVQAKGLPWNYANQDYGIRDQRVQFQRSEFQAIFDIQIERISKLLNSQMERLQRKYPGQPIGHLILSGGLGSSEYVQQQLSIRYASADTPFYHPEQVLRLRLAPEPQLAVCKGLIEDRLQKLITGRSVLPWRCCRESYGILFKEPYNKNNPDHFWRRKEVDTADGLTYCVDGIDWFIKIGQPVSSEHPIGHDFFRKITPAEPNRRFQTSIFRCNVLDSAALPRTLTKDCFRVGVVQSDFQQFQLSEFEEKKQRRCFGSSKKHYIIRYVIKAVVGPADLRFELWFKNMRVNQENAISVEWAASSPPQTNNNQLEVSTSQDAMIRRFV